MTHSYETCLIRDSEAVIGLARYLNRSCNRARTCSKKKTFCVWKRIFCVQYTTFFHPQVNGPIQWARTNFVCHYTIYYYTIFCIARPLSLYTIFHITRHFALHDLFHGTTLRYPHVKDPMQWARSDFALERSVATRPYDMTHSYGTCLVKKIRCVLTNYLCIKILVVY